jgi:hypothetical protein
MNSFNATAQQKSNEELLKMVYEFDEWNPEMLQAVEDELSKRNILPTDITTRKNKLIEAERKQLLEGKPAGPFGQIIGWLTIFGFLGIAIGYNYAFTKVRSRYTNLEYYEYNEAARKNGRFLFFASITLSVLFTIFKVVTA